MHSTSGQLQTSPPFDFEKSLAFFGGFTPTEGEQVVKKRSILKAVSIMGNAIAFEIMDSGDVENPQIAFTAHSEGEIPNEALIDRLRFFLSLDDDLQGFYAIAEKDNAFAPVLKRFYGHKQVKFLTPFENACWAILSQRVPMSFARKTKGAITEKFGRKIKVDGIVLWAFPEPSDLRDADKSELLEIVRNEKKCEYLASASMAFSQVDEKWLRTGPNDEAYAWLRSIKGIGEWSAQFVMLRGLGRMERISNVEEKLVPAVARVYGKPMSESRVLELAQNYGTHQGYWAYYVRIYSEFGENPHMRMD
ncbi:MAG: DNA-3-methyladenine glycosylase family protein [Nitrososphaerales archaeon]